MRAPFGHMSHNKVRLGGTNNPIFYNKSPLEWHGIQQRCVGEGQTPIFSSYESLPLDICHTTLVHTESSIMLHQLVGRSSPSLIYQSSILLLLPQTRPNPMFFLHTIYNYVYFQIRYPHPQKKNPNNQSDWVPHQSCHQQFRHKVFSFQHQSSFTSIQILSHPTNI